MSKVDKWFEKMNQYYDNVDKTKLNTDLLVAGFNQDVSLKAVTTFYDEVACSIDDDTLIVKNNEAIAIKI